MNIKPVPAEANILNWIRSHCKSTDYVLDIGCGEGRYSDIQVAGYIGVDSWPACNPHLLIDLNKIDLPWPANSYDVVLMIDFVEHLEKGRSKQLICQAMDICKREILLITPKLWTPNDSSFADENSVHFKNPDVFHKSHWTEDDFTEVSWRRERLYDKYGNEKKVSKEMLIYRWVK